IERAGGINVVDRRPESGGLLTVSLEQVLRWNPDTIVTTDRTFHTQVKTMPVWGSVEAIRRNRIFLSPSLPYGWIDSPPSLNRVLGLQWLAREFFPEQVRGDLRDDTRDFYKLFY